MYFLPLVSNIQLLTHWLTAEFRVFYVLGVIFIPKNSGWWLGFMYFLPLVSNIQLLTHWLMAEFRVFYVLGVIFSPKTLVGSIDLCISCLL